MRLLGQLYIYTVLLYIFIAYKITSFVVTLKVRESERERERALRLVEIEIVHISIEPSLV